MSKQHEHPDLALVKAALSRNPQAVRVLVNRLTPVVQTRVARALLRSGVAQSASLAHEVEDLCQDVFVALFAKEGQALRCWDPAVGIELETFVGVIAWRQAISRLRARRASAHRLVSDPTELAQPSDPSSFAARIEARHSIDALAAKLAERLSANALDMFHRLFLWDQSVDEVCAETGQSAAAVYQWRTRLRRAVQELFEQPSVTPKPTEGTPTLAQQEVPRG